MSTKTSFKRIALVAAASLAIAGFSAVPANAAVAGAAITDASDAIHLGGTATTAAAFTVTVDDEFGTLSLETPAGSAVTLTDNNGAVAGTDDIYADDAAGNVFTPADGKITVADAGTDPEGDITIVPDVEGTYTITLTAGTTTDTYKVYAGDLFVKSADGINDNGTQFNLTANGVAGVNNTVKIGFRSTTDARLIQVTGGKINATDGDTAFTVAEDKTSAVVVDGAAANLTFTVATPTAGTITIKAYDETQVGIFSTTAYGTVTITVNSAAVNGSVDVANSTAALGTASVTGTYIDATTDTTGYAARTANTKAAKVDVDLAATAGTLASTTATTIAVTGPGLVGFDMAEDGTGDNLGRSLTYTGTDAAFDVLVYGDGTSGAATVSVTTGAFSKKFIINFYGAVASYVVTGSNSHLSVGTTDASVATVKALDASGIAVPGAVVYTTSSSIATATVSATSVTTTTSGAAVAIGATGVAKGAAKINFANATSSATVTATHDLTIVAAGISSVALSFDKTSYAPGEKATITVTAKNADGALAGDQAYANLFTTAGITSSASLNGYTADASVTTTSGLKTYTVYMPLAGGPVTISAILGASVAAAIQDTTVTTATEVEADSTASLALDAANAATDAANNAYDEAQNATQAASDALAAVTALAAQVKSLIASVKKLTSAVAKLKK